MIEANKKKRRDKGKGINIYAISNNILMTSASEMITLFESNIISAIY